MVNVPYESMSVDWLESSQNKEDRFLLSLPWVSMEVNVTEQDRTWIKDAVARLHIDYAHENVQKFIQELKDYPISYVQPRKLENFEGQDLQECPDIDVNSSSPSCFIETFGCPIDSFLRREVISNWTWDQEKILSKARIEGTDLYDPVSFVTYLACYRLEWESTGWLGQDGFGTFLRNLLKKDEKQFFEAIGRITKQAWYITAGFCSAMEPALICFPKGKKAISSYIAEEVGHYKFMEQVFKDLDLDKDIFPVAPETEWLLASFERAAALSPLAFSAMVGLFEAAYYEEDEPISGTLKYSSRPYAARGYDLHYKVNQQHRHCDVPLHLASYLAPQTHSHALLTVGLFELTLNVLNQMEQKLAKSFGEKMPNRFEDVQITASSLITHRAQSAAY